MKTAPILGLIYDVKKEFPTLKAAFKHVACLTNRSV